MATRIFSNAWVKRRGPEELSAQADKLRELCGLENEYNLNVIEVLRRVENTELPGKGRLKTIVHPDAPRGYKAYVTYEPLELHVERITFERARWNSDRQSKYILSHELGHIVLHDHLNVPFSNSDTHHKITGNEEIQAEWQANYFADHLLLPDHIVSQFTIVDQLVTSCGVSQDLAERRFSRRQHLNRFKTLYSGDFCAHCHNPSLVRRAYLLECDNCGESYSGL